MRLCLFSATVGELLELGMFDLFFFRALFWTNQLCSDSPLRLDGWIMATCFGKGLVPGAFLCTFLY